MFVHTFKNSSGYLPEMGLGDEGGVVMSLLNFTVYTL